MEALTSAADAILNEGLGEFILTPPMKSSRKALANITNKKCILPDDQTFGSSLNALFNEKITSLPKSKSIICTPKKRRKNSLKFGDENQAPSPKTPRNSISFEKFTDSPATPLSNLKMLTRIASLEEHIPSKKSLFGLSCEGQSKLGLRRCVSESFNLKHGNEVEKEKLKKHSTVCDLEDIECPESSDGYELTSNFGHSRKEKSLGYLCDRFLDHFPMEISCLETPRKLIIDDIAHELGTERRRVYDIVNILECLNMASRVQKNIYQWMGKQYLENTLSKLKGLAQEYGICVRSLKSPVFSKFNEQMSLFNPRTILLRNGNESSSKLLLSDVDARKEKSIGILCQKFLMLFLITPHPHILHLDIVAQFLLGRDGSDIEKLRNRGRRIYDIANVLVSLRLIKKLPQCKSFMYVGPKVEALQGEKFTTGPNQTKLRHSLLPPPINVVHPKGFYDLKRMTAITPLNAENIDGIGYTKHGNRPSNSKAKRNCLIGRTKSEESRLQSIEHRHHSSLQDICEVAEVEREKLKECGDRSNTSEVFNQIENNRSNNKKIPEALKCRLGRTFRFPFLVSPKVALTFQNPPSPNPLRFTNQPPSLEKQGVSKVIVKPPFILRKYNFSVPSSNDAKSIGSSNVGGQSKKPVVQSERVNDFPVNQLGNSSKIFSEKNSKHFRTLSLPNMTSSEQSSFSSVNKTLESKKLNVFQPKIFSKSLSQMAVPNVNLNTLSKNHYKTVLGVSTKMLNHEQSSSVSLNSSNNGGYHFVISSKLNSSSDSAESTSTILKHESGVAIRQPTFVKILQSSPDNSSTDSELESIFGDSFNFTRPKNLVTKI